MKLPNLLRPLTAACAMVLLGAAAHAAPITMSPDPVTFNGVRGTFTLDLTSGDSSTNVLTFKVTGSNPAGPLPAAGVATLIFSGTNILSESEISDPDSMLSGLTLPHSGEMVGVLIDFGAPSTATFKLKLSSTPTTATLTSITSSGFLSTKTEKVTLTFNTPKPPVDVPPVYVPPVKPPVHPPTLPPPPPTHGGGAAIPEPSAALCFAAGLLLVGSRLRRP